VNVTTPIERMVRQRQESIAGGMKAALTTFLGEGL
jgi:hypothetical protein